MEKIVFFEHNTVTCAFYCIITLAPTNKYPVYEKTMNSLHPYLLTAELNKRVIALR